MEKPFLEVFPGLYIADELKELLKLVMVEKVTMTKDRSSMMSTGTVSSWS